MFGWLLSGDDLPQDWGNIGTAMLTLFVLLTLEDFPRYMERAMEIHQWAWIYFVTYLGVAVFIVVNVLIAIVLNSMEEARELERRRRLAAGRAKPGRSHQRPFWSGSRFSEQLSRSSRKSSPRSRPGGFDERDLCPWAALLAPRPRPQSGQ